MSFIQFTHWFTSYVKLYLVKLKSSKIRCKYSYFLWQISVFEKVTFDDNYLKFNYLTCDPVGIKPLQGFFPYPAPRAILHGNTWCAGLCPTFLCRNFQSVSELPSCPSDTKTPDHPVRRIMFSCDPVGIRTQDPQLRRLLLYPAELPDRTDTAWQSAMRTEAVAKIKFILVMTK